MPTLSPVAPNGLAAAVAAFEATPGQDGASTALTSGDQTGDALALEQACFGAGLPPLAEQELQLASRANYQEQAAERHLLRALRHAPQHPAVYIGLYRFYFYHNRLREALDVGQRCLALAAALNGLPVDWRRVSREQAAFDGYAILPRFYLFTLKACAYLHLRLGELAPGAAMLDQLSCLDSSDRLKGSVLRAVLDRRGQDDDE